MKTFVTLGVAAALVFTMGTASALLATPAAEPTPLEKMVAEYNANNGDRPDVRAEDAILLADDLPTTGYKLTVDWETMNVITEPYAIPTGPGPNVASCVYPAGGGGWLQPGVGVDCIPYNSYGWGISHTALACVAGTCYVDGLNFDFLNYGFVVVLCGSPDAAVVDWGASTITTGACFAFVFGSNPTTWTSWDALSGGGGGAGAHLG